MANSGALDPKVLDRLSSLDFVARTVVEGYMAGQHRSPLRGSSVEFAQHREYVPGDDLRRVDWTVYAKSDRLVVKEFIAETNLACHLLFDSSESMAFGSLAWTKHDYARWAAGALAHMILSQRDLVGLSVFDSELKSSIPASGGARQRLAVLETLEAATPTGPTGVGSVLHALVPTLRQRGVVCVFSDFFDEPDQILEGVRHLVHAGHEPILFQVLDPLELSFDLDALVRLEGLENSGQQKIDPAAIREAYREEIQNHIKDLSRKARAMNVDFVSLVTDKPLDAVLSTYLARRKARARAGGRG